MNNKKELDYLEETLLNLQTYILDEKNTLPRKLVKEISHNFLKAQYLICRYRTLGIDWDKKDWDKKD